MHAASRVSECGGEAKGSTATQTSLRGAKHLDPHYRQAMPGHTQTEPTFHLTRKIIPILETFKFIAELCSQQHSTENNDSDIKLPERLSSFRICPLQSLHRPSRCNITSSALFQMSAWTRIACVYALAYICMFKAMFNIQICVLCKSIIIISLKA